MRSSVRRLRRVPLCHLLAKGERLQPIRGVRHKADAKSIMKILMLAAPQGTEIKITAAGKDESMAIKSLENLIKAKFNEEH